MSQYHGKANRLLAPTRLLTSRGELERIAHALFPVLSRTRLPILIVHRRFFLKRQSNPTAKNLQAGFLPTGIWPSEAITYVLLSSCSGFTAQFANSPPKVLTAP